MADNKMGMVIYRYNDNEDLEILMVDNNGQMELPETEFSCCDDFEASTGIPAADNEDVIELDGEDSAPKQGLVNKAFALEARMENKMRKFLSIREEEGNYVAMKEAVKKVLPHQYTILKELKDILMERNITKYL